MASEQNNSTLVRCRVFDFISGPQFSETLSLTVIGMSTQVVILNLDLMTTSFLEGIHIL